MNRKAFGILVRKSIVEKILFSDKRYFQLDGRQNIRIYAATCEEADHKGNIHRKTPNPIQVMVWLGVCLQDVTRPVIIDEGTLNAD